MRFRRAMIESTRNEDRTRTARVLASTQVTPRVTQPSSKKTKWNLINSPAAETNNLLGNETIPPRKYTTIRLRRRDKKPQGTRTVERNLHKSEALIKKGCTYKPTGGYNKKHDAPRPLKNTSRREGKKKPIARCSWAPVHTFSVIKWTSKLVHGSISPRYNTYGNPPARSGCLSRFIGTKFCI